VFSGRCLPCRSKAVCLAEVLLEPRGNYKPISVYAICIVNGLGSGALSCIGWLWLCFGGGEEEVAPQTVMGGPLQAHCSECARPKRTEIRSARSCAPKEPQGRLPMGDRRARNRQPKAAKRRPLSVFRSPQTQIPRRNDTPPEPQTLATGHCLFRRRCQARADKWAPLCGRNKCLSARVAPRKCWPKWELAGGFLARSLARLGQQSVRDARSRLERLC